MRFLDQQLGRLLSRLKRRPEPVGVVITSDHGEMLTPNTRYHGYTLLESIVRIPMLAKVPGWPKGRIAEPVSLIDIMPTLLGLSATPAPPQLSGLNLGMQIEDGASWPQRALYADSWLLTASGRRRLDLAACIDGDSLSILDLLRGQLKVMPLPQDLKNHQRPPEPRLRETLYRYVELAGRATADSGAVRTH